jgi:hypothetical protein
MMMMQNEVLQHLVEFEVSLPIGYTDANGTVHRRAVLRKMRGHEEALLYDQSLTTGQLVTALLLSCLVRLGDLPALDAATVAALYTADRNYLLLELRRITLGNSLLAWYSCPRCGGQIQVLEDLSQVGVRRLADQEALSEIVFTLEDGYVDRHGVQHNELTLTLPSGADEEFIAPMAEKDPLKAQDALLLRCIKRFGTLPKAALEAYGVKILRELTLGDRRRLHKVFQDQTPGVDFRRTVACPQCQATFQGMMDLSNFFVLS